MGGGSREALEKFLFRSILVLESEIFAPWGAGPAATPIRRSAVPQYHRGIGQPYRSPCFVAMSERSERKNFLVKEKRWIT